MSLLNHNLHFISSGNYSAGFERRNSETFFQLLIAKSNHEILVCVSRGTASWGEFLTFLLFLKAEEEERCKEHLFLWCMSIEKSLWSIELHSFLCFSSKSRVNYSFSYPTDAPFCSTLQNKVSQQLIIMISSISKENTMSYSALRINAKSGGGIFKF